MRPSLGSKKNSQQTPRQSAQGQAAEGSRPSQLPEAPRPSQLPEAPRPSQLPEAPRPSQQVQEQLKASTSIVPPADAEQDVRISTLDVVAQTLITVTAKQKFLRFTNKDPPPSSQEQDPTPSSSRPSEVQGQPEAPPPKLSQSQGELEATTRRSTNQADIPPSIKKPSLLAKLFRWSVSVPDEGQEQESAEPEPQGFPF